ncbi:unnamed protein product [Ambrosiozyma monospora]|uniref:Unnamed protein product n=1 Tax=Ambrosiozyma monospora TaxID=43982 RepID=A0ACB5U2V6_AMBMO|nr:unnamed protein product [Ambrosiozyma monospora]
MVPIKIEDTSCPDELDVLKKHFDYLVPLQAPGSKKSIFSCYHALVNVPLTKNEKKKMMAESKKHKITFDDLLLNSGELISHGYPIHPETAGDKTELISDQFIPTKKFEHEGCTTFALDCEMCRAKSGKVLTRVSLTDVDGNVIVDELVKPDEEIIDYVTKYSGISEEMLKGVKTTFKDAQQLIIKHVSSKDILIGHSLESDLNTLKISHPRIIDTALCFDHPRGPPSKASLKLQTGYCSERF